MINENISLDEIAGISILKLAIQHKKTCIHDSECGISLYPLRAVIEKLINRKLTEEENKILL